MLDKPNGLNTSGEGGSLYCKRCDIKFVDPVIAFQHYQVSGL
jgi:hypothetical protein